MEVGFVTNLRAPYRTLQLNKFNEIKDVNINAYYTDKPDENRNWNVNKASFNEVNLKGIRISRNFGYLNRGLFKIIKNNDLIVLGCYEKPTYILLSLFCKIFNKPYILSYDGISANRLYIKEKWIKRILKKIVIQNANYIMGNGTVSRRYFNEKFSYPLNRIYNQYLTVDSEMINMLYREKDKYREQYRGKYNIDEGKKVLIYSGRVIGIKNIDSVIKAISRLQDKNIVLLIIGGGEKESELVKLASKLNVEVIITGFIIEQEELFKHYFAGDALILPSSVYEVWGLVVNEAMFSGLPILVSDICGCSLDLVKNQKNGYKFNPFDVNDISEKINIIFKKENMLKMGNESREIIKPWTFNNSKKQLELIINKLKNKEK